MRLEQPKVQRRVRAITDRLYVPVGASHRPDHLACWVSGYLFDGEDGRAAAARVDPTISKFPGILEFFHNGTIRCTGLQCLTGGVTHVLSHQDVSLLIDCNALDEP